MMKFTGPIEEFDEYVREQTIKPVIDGMWLMLKGMNDEALEECAKYLETRTTGNCWYGTYWMKDSLLLLIRDLQKMRSTVHT